ncbi:MAG: hypothetical protein AB1657_05105 [Candidatus Micrarchaeota archaeon]
MGDFMNAVRAILAIVVGAGIGYFWKLTRPNDDLLTVAGVSVVSIVLLYLLLRSIGKGS